MGGVRAWFILIIYLSLLVAVGAVCWGENVLKSMTSLKPRNYTGDKIH